MEIRFPKIDYHLPSIVKVAKILNKSPGGVVATSFVRFTPLSDPTFVDAVLAAAKVEEFKSKVYSIGPFGIRVGFAYQQERALNLVYALVKDGRVNASQRILIAGGGLAGLTAKIAFHGMGFGDVWLYEERDRILKWQHDAHHRQLHPCYNNWPIADYFSPTSNLPFFNWYSSSAADVVAFLNQRWTDLYSRKLTAVRTSHIVANLELTPRKGQDQRIAATIRNSVDGTERIQEFDLAILATGFGREKDLSTSSSKSYWESDEVDRIREDENDTRRIFVSGIGDGGLMDFIRFGYRSVANSDLAIEAISHLRHAKYSNPRDSLEDNAFSRSPVEHRIRSIEKEALDRLPQSALPRREFGTAIENEISEKLFRGYQTVIEMLPRAADEFLDSRMHRITQSDRLRLVGRLAFPFTCATAPINKLLAAYLIKRSPNLYERGYVDLPGAELIKKSGERVDLRDQVLVLRHGGRPPAFDMSKKFARQNRSLNRTMADLVSIERLDSDLCANLQDIVSVTPQARTYADYRGGLAKAFSSRITGVVVSPRFSRKQNHEPFWFDLDSPSPSSIDRIAKQFGGFPHEIFGVKLLRSEPLDADSGLGGSR